MSFHEFLWISMSPNNVNHKSFRNRNMITNKKQSNQRHQIKTHHLQQSDHLIFDRYWLNPLANQQTWLYLKALWVAIPTLIFTPKWPPVFFLVPTTPFSDPHPECFIPLSQTKDLAQKPNTHVDFAEKCFQDRLIWPVTYEPIQENSRTNVNIARGLFPSVRTFNVMFATFTTKRNRLRYVHATF